MELREISGFDEDGNLMTINLPIPRVIRMALLNLDFSKGTISNMDARNQLADQFCLTDTQKKAKTERNASVNLWGEQVNGAIAALVDAKKLIQPKPATIITPEALQVIISLFLQKIGYEPTQIDIVENHSEMPFSVYVDIETKSLKFGVACDFTRTPADA